MEEFLQVGAIANTHGIAGEVKVFPMTDDIKRFTSALEVGEMVGIHGRSTFFAQFSEVTGMSPGEYRRRYAGGDPIAPSQE